MSHRPMCAALISIVLAASLAACGSSTSLPSSAQTASTFGTGMTSAAQLPHCSGTQPLYIHAAFSPTRVPLAGPSNVIITLSAGPTSCNVKKYTPVSAFLTLPPQLYLLGSAATSSTCAGTTFAVVGHQAFGFYNTVLGLGSSCTMTFQAAGSVEGTWTFNIPANVVVSPQSYGSPATYANLQVTAPIDWP